MNAPAEVRAERELRIAVVMYGGVSLAVYMNGVAQELLNFVRATSDAPDASLGKTSAAVYRQVARLRANPAGALQPGVAIRQRVVIDILSGTSAGGINAIFLAKALARNQSLDGLARMWETEADLGKLINDGDSRAQTALKLPKGPPRSLLNSRRMYLKLLEAFTAMDNEPRLPGSALVDELDLFVTATDIAGLPVRLQLGGGEVAEERRYRKAFHLRFNARYPDAKDFEPKDNPFLAFIARCTSSFPFAFEPMQVAQAKEEWLDGRGMTDPTPWMRHFTEYEAADGPGHGWEQRPFGDGGYLDNKPFSYAIDAIAARSGSRTARVERKLVFVDPSPERLQARTARTKEHVPNAVQNTLTALKLPAYESIREDLLRLRERNRVVDKVQSVVRGVTDDFNRLNVDQARELVALLNNRGAFDERDLNAVVPLFGAAYGGYHRLKVGNVTDELASVVAAQAGIALDSDESRLLRFLVRGWRDLRFTRNPHEEQAQPDRPRKRTEFAFLRLFDLSYRTRRLAFVIEQINRLSSATTDEWQNTLGFARAFGEDALAVTAADTWDVVLDELHARRSQLVLTLGAMREGREALFGGPGGSLPGTSDHWPAIGEGLKELRDLSGDRARKTRAAVFQAVPGSPGDRAMEAVMAAVAIEVDRLATMTRAGSGHAVREIGSAELPARRAGTAAGLAENVVRHYYAWYELYDSMIFPIVHGSEVGEEIAPVEPVRISPLTGRAAAGSGTMDPKFLPAGLALGHFGGFLDADWRANDILLGRLNATEKLIGILVTGMLPEPAPGGEAERKREVDAYVRDAQQAIIAEERDRRGSRVKAWMARIPNADSPGKILDEVRSSGLQNTELPRERALAWITRSVHVTGKVFDQAADGPVAEKLTGVLTRAGQVLSAVAEVAVPRHWWGLLYRRWVAQLWLFGLLLAVLGLVFGQDQMQLLGLKWVAVVSGFGALTLVLKWWVREQRWLLVLRLILSALVLVLVIVGAAHLWNLRYEGLAWLADAWRRVAVRTGM